MAIITLFQPYPLATQVCLVTDQRNLRRVWPLVEKLWPQGKRVAGFRRCGVDHQQYPVSLANGLQRPFHTNLFHMVIGGPQPGGVHHMQRHAINVDMFAQNIPCGAGNVGDDRRFAPGQLVQQAGFTGIGPAGDNHRHAVAQQCTLPGLALHGG